MLAAMDIMTFKTLSARRRLSGALAIAASAIAVMIASSGKALASSDDAWEDFRAAVEAGCLQASAGVLDDPVAVVDPFGSQHYGLAVLTGNEAGTKVAKSVICVYDKQDLTAEIGGPLDLVPVAPSAAAAGRDGIAAPASTPQR